MIADEKLTFWNEIEDTLVVVYFVLSTFFTQIVILNMLIAIMGATFGRHSEQLHASKTRQRLLVQAEFIFLVDLYIDIWDNIMCCGICRRGNKRGIGRSKSASE